MKKVLNLVLVMMLALTAAFSITACVDNNRPNGATGLLSKINSEDVLIIYDYIGDAEVLDIAEELDIPDGIEKVRIKSTAFSGNGTIKTLIVPETVTEIEAGAFKNMKSLEKLTVPFVGKNANSDAFQNESASAEDKAVNSERTIAHFFGAESFDDGVSVTINYGASTTTCYMPAALKEITVKSTAAYSIPMYAFSGATNFSKIVLGDNVDAIGVNAFEDTWFASIVIPTSVKNIYEGAFKNATIKTVNVVGAQGSITIAEDAVGEDCEIKYNYVVE